MRTVLTRKAIVQLNADVHMAKKLLANVEHEEMPEMWALKEVLFRINCIETFAKNLMAKVNHKKQIVMTRKKRFWWLEESGCHF